MDSFSSIFGAIFAFLGIIMLVLLVWAVFIIIAEWKLFVKAGVPGWAVLVPYYNTYKFTEIATNDKRLCWASVGIQIASSVVSLASSASTSSLMTTGNISEASSTSGALSGLSSLISLASLVVNGYICYMFAKSYGKSTTFSVLSILFGGITILIMGFDRNTQYVGPKGVPQFNGFDNGYGYGYGNNGYNNGYGNNGYNNGYGNNGYNNGYGNNGYNNGYGNNGYNNGYGNNGYNNGYGNNGYKNGYGNNGTDANSDNTMNTIDTTNTTDNSDKNKTSYFDEL